MRKIARIVMFVLGLGLLLPGNNLTAAGKVNYSALPKKVDAIFAPYNRKDSPGAAVLIMKDGKILYQHGYGMANLEYDIPITSKTLFHVASDSKQFTAFAILLLAVEGKLSLDDDIRAYLPQMPDFGKKITIRNLINHTSGLRDQWELLIMAGWRMDDVITQDQILRIIYRQKELNYAPGTDFLYCNTGYTLLAEIVAKVSGQSLVDFTKQRIFEPLGMKNTHFHDHYATIEKNMAYSYAPGNNGQGFQKSVLSYATVGATSLFTTAEDLTKWVNNFETMQVGSPEVMAQMLTPGKLNNGKALTYACGLMVGDYQGLKYFTHSGGDAGYRSTIYSFPDQRLGIVILSNLATISPDNLAWQIAGLYLPDVIQSPNGATQNKHQEITIDSAIYNDYPGRYQLQPGFIITLTNENNHLMAQATGQTKFELYPEGKDTFFAKVDEIQVIFVRSPEGKVSGLRVLQAGQDLLAGKMKEPTPLTPAQLSKYGGEYYSEELATTYQLYVKEGRLNAYLLRFGEIPLEQTEKDRFAFQGTTLAFERDQKSRITGIRVSSGRVRNLRFKKVK